MGETENLKLWYKKPARKWEEALPIGNGRLGGMVYGRIYSEMIQLNEDSVWYGGAVDRNNPDAYRNLSKIRQLIFDGKIREAEELTAFALSGIPESQRHYEPLGNLCLFFANQKGNVQNYKRELALCRGTVTTEYQLDGIGYKREIFASYPQQIMVIRLTADRPGAISFHTQLARGNELWGDEPVGTGKLWYSGGFNAFVDRSCAIGSDGSMMSGQCGGKGAVEFCGRIKVKAEGGQVKTIGNSVVVNAADAAVIYLAAETTFRETDAEGACAKRIKQAEEYSYEKLLAAHLKDYEELFGRVRIDVQSSRDRTIDSLPTDERMKRHSLGEEDQGLINLFFQYGRYLLIASSRPGSLPANLQGLWNREMLPAWDSKYTININTQMNYWPAETCNLSECHVPLFDLIERMRAPGRKTAELMYGCRGFMAHHNTDIWADTAPQDVCLSSTYWMMGAAWLCLHLWEHYEFTKDAGFLSGVYETMREAALFLVDFLIEDADGYLVVCPSISPENEYRLNNGETGVLCKGASMDSQIIYALFHACIRASELLDRDLAFRQELELLLKKIPEPQIGKYGQIMEWKEDYEELDPGHRHIS
ncbi:MAG TPA: glycoside hydrolase family 95 protein, partial [Lachnospiraceae bacterium]|nr:glycoside hydrolase family 95 protein [Lachnospiraceae bacterium]